MIRAARGLVTLRSAWQRRTACWSIWLGTGSPPNAVLTRARGVVIGRSLRSLTVALANAVITVVPVLVVIAGCDLLALEPQGQVFLDVSHGGVEPVAHHRSAAGRGQRQRVEVSFVEVRPASAPRGFKQGLDVLRVWRGHHCEEVEVVCLAGPENERAVAGSEPGGVAGQQVVEPPSEAFRAFLADRSHLGGLQAVGLEGVAVCRNDAGAGGLPARNALHLGLQTLQYGAVFAADQALHRRAVGFVDGGPEPLHCGVVNDVSSVNLERDDATIVKIIFEFEILQGLVL